MGGPTSAAPTLCSSTQEAGRKQGAQENREKVQRELQSLPPISRPNREGPGPPCCSARRPSAWHAAGVLEVSVLHSEGLGVKAMAGEAPRGVLG